MRLLIFPLLIATAGCALTPAERERAAVREETAQQKLATALVGLTPGEPVGCISQFQSQQVKGYGSTIVYTVTGNLKYVSQTAGGCEGIGRGDVLVTRSNTGGLCRGDIAQTFDSASRFPTGSCSFGDFTPYRKR